MTSTRKLLLLAFLLVLAPFCVWAQVTTGTISGTVKTDNGNNLEGASITALHEATGSKYHSVSASSGAFTLPNLRIGGPYTVTFHYTGYADAIFRDIYVTLGTATPLAAIMATSAQELTGVTVTANRGLTTQKAGASTQISTRTLQSLPTINRSVQDFARITPQVKSGNGGNDGTSRGLSFAGQSNRYNQFSIDGANTSDAFGLGSSGTIGGQANVNPISLESIQEVQIVLSPYDITQGGFTGGGINAVTKSGTNTFHGSVYGNYQNQNFIGKSSAFNDKTTRNEYPKFSNKTYGASLGGAIVKNKLFFFVSGERYEKSTPVAFDPTEAGSGSRVSVDTLAKIRKFMQDNYGFDLGGYGAIANKNESTSFFGRIDWNISDKHKLTIRHNYVDGSNQIRSRTATNALFENNGYQFTTNSNSSVIELNSSFSSRASNILRVTYNRVRDRRSTSAAPNVSVTSWDNAQNTSIVYALGSDYSSAANSLDQDVFSITDNFTLYKGKHTLTFGTNNEFFQSSNVFLQGWYGAYTYNNTSLNSANRASTNLSNFMANTGMTRYQIAYSTKGRGDRASADLKTAQFSVYGQDVWDVNQALKLTYGLRIDLPVINGTPDENVDFNTAFASFGVKTNQKPKTRLMFSPRIGFNYNFKDAHLQLRGGAGLFTGRVPFVWISNQYSNTGVAFRSTDFGNNAAVVANGVSYKFDKNDPQLGAFIPSASSGATTINVIDKNFKFPQIFRANLAADKQLPWGLLATVEALFTKNINNAMYRNLNISENGESQVTIAGTKRPYWSTIATNPAYSQVIEIGNTSKGFSTSFTAQIQKMYSAGWSGSLAYTWGTARSMNDIPSSVALSNWQGVTSVNGLNKLDYARSNFDMGSRINGFISKEFKYGGGFFATTFTLFYNGQSGQRLSYVYASLNSRSITNDAPSAISLAYLPKTFEEANFVDIANGQTASQQWTSYQNFMGNNKYLSENAGSNAKRNGDKLPWENHFDFRIAQDFKFKTHKLQIFFDVINVGALLNKDWGRSYVNGSDPDGFFPVTSQLFQPVVQTSSVTYTRDGAPVTATATNPAFQFNVNSSSFTDIDGKLRPYTVSTFTSRWNSQIGIRYSF